MKPIDKSQRRIPREIVVYPDLETAVQAHLDFVEKQLKGIDLSNVIQPDRKR